MLNFEKATTYNTQTISGHSSVVERLVANEKVEGSTPFARSILMIKLCVEGWRKINHSYAIVNQKQLIELSKLPIHLRHKDITYGNQNWNEVKNFNGFSDLDNNIIDSIKIPSPDEVFDITFRISFPYNYERSTSEKLFVYGTAEYQNIENHYKNTIKKDKIFNNQLKIITPSNWSKEGFTKFGFRDDQVFVIPNGVDKKNFYFIEEHKKNEIKKKFGIKTEDFVISNIGAMSENKGIDYLLVAYFVLKEKYKNIKLLLKDQSNLYQINASQYINKMKNSKYSHLINENSLKDIIFISENLSFSNINELYNISDCYVSPYRAEGFNMTPLEAAACGTPIIVTKGGSTDDYFNSCLGLQIESELVQNKEKTMLKPNLESLIACITDVHQKKDIFNNEKSIQYVNNNYNWKIITKKLFNIFSQT